MEPYQPIIDDSDPKNTAKEIIKSWCDYNREKYGPNWKEIVAAEMAKDTVTELAKAGIIK